jgi:hypothetical protein
MAPRHLQDARFVERGRQIFRRASGKFRDSRRRASGTQRALAIVVCKPITKENVMSSFISIDSLSLSTVTGGGNKSQPQPAQLPPCQPVAPEKPAPFIDIHPKFTGAKVKKSPITYNGGAETTNNNGVANGTQVKLPLLAGGGGVE